MRGKVHGAGREWATANGDEDEARPLVVEIAPAMAITHEYGVQCCHYANDVTAFDHPPPKPWMLCPLQAPPTSH